MEEPISWSSHYFAYNAAKELNYGDKIKLPAVALEQLLAKAGSQPLPSPLTFQLRHPTTSKIIHCGVKEFSVSETDRVELPEWIMTFLSLTPGDRILIKLLILPKATWTQLKPISTNYREIQDYRAALEDHLRKHYNTLTQGQVLSCRYGGQNYLFEVAELKPANAVSINDTDLEVDIAGSVDLGYGSTSSDVTLNQTLSHVDIPHKAYTYWTLKLSSPKDLQIRLKVESGDVDVVMSSEEKQPKVDHHMWADISSDSERTIRLTRITSKVLYIGIYGYEENSTVSWEATELDDEPMDTTLGENKAEEGKIQCKNCQAWILERTAVLHEGFCYRNNVLCLWGCGRVFKKGSKEAEEHWHCDQCDKVGSIEHKKKHVEYDHTSKACICNQFTTDSYSSLSAHKLADCSEKMIICKYCHILVGQGTVSLDARDRLLGLRSHESYCGSRTITCQKCNKPIPIKDIQVHAKIHDIKRQQQILPPSCANLNCIRPRVKNRLSLCQYCFGPFWSTEDDPKNAKLVQRVARKIHSQLITGCGNEWCRNEYCATYTKKPKDATTAASLLIPLIKNLPQELNKANPDPQLYFCVDESISRKRLLAEVLQGEKYELGWCVKAIENEQEDLDRAKAWLDRNAPRKNYV
ncbi:hypothetical protein G6F56_003074 [Rhizopus delemar]|nr:hypothetical protein G6F56_003074 [Rhizopus delemar]